MHATSLGGVESTLERRRRWKAEAATIPDGLVRLSVGIEDVVHLGDALRRALDGWVGGAREFGVHAMDVIRRSIRSHALRCSAGDV